MGSQHVTKIVCAIALVKVLLIGRHDFICEYTLNEAFKDLLKKCPSWVNNPADYSAKNLLQIKDDM